MTLRALGISLEPKEAIALLGGDTRFADVGKVNGHYFTNVVAIGHLAEAVGDVSVEQKTSYGPFAYLVEGVKAAVENESFDIEVLVNGQTYKEKAMLFLCVLTNSVGSFTKMNKHADPSDGMLHCFIIKSGNLLQLIGMAKNFLSGSYEQDDNVIQFDTNEMIFKANETANLNIDGDLIGKLPANISILHNHIEFYC